MFSRAALVFEMEPTEKPTRGLGDAQLLATLAALRVCVHGWLREHARAGAAFSPQPFCAHGSAAVVARYLPTQYPGRLVVPASWAADCELSMFRGALADCGYPFADCAGDKRVFTHCAHVSVYWLGYEEKHMRLYLDALFVTQPPTTALVVACACSRRQCYWHAECIDASYRKCKRVCWHCATCARRTVPSRSACATPCWAPS